ncbi:hypothetical protein [Streptomonospora litoralis]|uniref:Uncharacterized protein n=1 Tax=Streptomonospora litoralis TaxID=2498135 RepID=A0A4P6Q456_9ACTN|nr:hypothetical protein [Streptomonospora litoralis]QBI55020.1 hypothetical protein EKD16_16240 [Streptomonospora litoralis]
MSPADDHTDPQNRGAPQPHPHDWLDAYVHFRLAALDPDLDGVCDPDEAPGDDGAAEPAGPPPPAPEVTAEELADHLSDLARRYRRRHRRDR